MDWLIYDWCTYAIEKQLLPVYFYDTICLMMLIDFFLLLSEFLLKPLWLFDAFLLCFVYFVLVRYCFTCWKWIYCCCCCMMHCFLVDWFLFSLFRCFCFDWLFCLNVFASTQNRWQKRVNLKIKMVDWLRMMVHAFPIHIFFWNSCYTTAAFSWCQLQVSPVYMML